MYMICRHIKTNGLRCESPALKGTQFCYYHSKVHTVGAEPHLKYGPLQLPAPEDSAAIQLSVARINDAIVNGRLDLKKATAIFYGIQIAAQFIDRKKYFHQEQTVQSAEQTVQGDELAPGKYICNKDEDCNICPFCTVGQCTRWHYVEDKNEDAAASDNDDEDANEDEAEDGEDEDKGEDEGDEDEDEDDEPSQDASRSLTA